MNFGLSQSQENMIHKYCEGNAVALVAELKNTCIKTIFADAVVKYLKTNTEQFQRDLLDYRGESPLHSDVVRIQSNIDFFEGGLSRWKVTCLLQQVKLSNTIFCGIGILGAWVYGYSKKFKKADLV